MYRRILIATDGSRLSLKAIKQGVALARSVGAAVVGFHTRLPAMLPYYSEQAIVLPPSTEKLLGNRAAARSEERRVGKECVP